MLRHEATFLSGIKVNLSWGGNPHDLIDVILEENGCVREKQRPDGDFTGEGCVSYCGDLSYVVWFEKKPSFKTMGTVAHEVFHLWTYWVQRMDRDLDINSNNPSSMEVDAYFFSDICDWIVGCSKK